jgi:hypothetical protein
MMKLQELIDKSVEITDNMNGYYSLYIKNLKPYYNKIRKTYSKYRTVQIYICHCEICGKEDFRYKRSQFPDVILCRKKKCKLKHYQRNIKPIKYDGKIYKIEECPKGYFRNHRNPLKGWIYAINANKKKKYAHQTEEWKQSQLEKHPEWSYAYYIKSNTDLVIDFSKSWEQRQKEFYHNNPWNYEQYIKHRRNYRNKWEYKDRTNRPGKYIVKRVIRSVFERINKKKIKSTSEMGFDIEGIINKLTDSAKQLGFKDLQDIKKTNKYHVDHIIPCAKYDLQLHEERLKCNNPLNLRWLLKKDNLVKSDNIRLQDLEIIKTLPKSIYPKGFDINTYTKKGDK